MDHDRFQRTTDTVKSRYRNSMQGNPAYVAAGDSSHSDEVPLGRYDSFMDRSNEIGAEKTMGHHYSRPILQGDNSTDCHYIIPLSLGQLITPVLSITGVDYSAFLLKR